MTAAPHTAPLASDGTPPRRSLILAGGGMRVAYQAGVLRALEEAGLRFAHGDGTSGGIMNLAMLLSGLSPTEMCERWRTLAVKDFVSLVPVEDYLRVLDLPSWGDADGIVGKVFPHLGIDVGRINAATGLDGTFNLCNYTRKTVESVPHGSVTIDHLVAGISLPIFMAPVRYGDELYIDAVWIKDANLMEAVRRGAEEIWLVWCIGNHGVYQGGAFHQYVHMIEMSANGALFEELDRIADINTRIAAGESVGGRTRPVVLHVIRPEYPLPLDPDYFFGRITGAALIDMGYADASRYLETMRPEGVPLTPDATRMRDARPGVTFRETMSGTFALGASDPRSLDGATGERAELAMHARIAIPDVERFVSDPGHAGLLTGEIDFPPLGERIPAQRGTFRLFVPADVGGGTRMVYEMAFEHGGRDYYLAGHKDVRNDPGFDALRDTTTLFTTLHQGRDATAPVVGAGVLRLGLEDLVRLASTIQATGCETLADRAKTIATFGRFFLGELWGSYGVGRGSTDAGAERTDAGHAANP